MKKAKRIHWYTTSSLPASLRLLKFPSVLPLRDNRINSIIRFTSGDQLLSDQILFNDATVNKTFYFKVPKVSSMKALDFKEYLEKISPGLSSEEGFRFGNPNLEVKGILVSWMATKEAIEKAIDEDCNFMIVHEDLFYPYEFQRDETFEKYLTWSVNHTRLKMLAEHNITVFRAHGTLDRLCILDDFAETLGLPEPTVRKGYVRIYDVPSITVKDLALDVKKKLNLKAVRVVGDFDREISRIGLPWGGLGLSLNIGFLEELLRYAPQVLIAGETDEYAMYYALDADVNIIETGHSISENIGLKGFVEKLKRDHPETKIVFYECEKPWRFL